MPRQRWLELTFVAVISLIPSHVATTVIVAGTSVVVIHIVNDLFPSNRLSKAFVRINTLEKTVADLREAGLLVNVDRVCLEILKYVFRLVHHSGITQLTLWHQDKEMHVCH
jgi:hypothetical protein